MKGSRKGGKERTGAMGWAPAAGSAWSAPHPGQPGTPGPGWPPASPGGRADAGWGIAGGQGGTPPPALRRRGRTMTAAAVATVAAVAVATGFEIGHEVWPAGSSVQTASQGGAALPNNTGSGTAENPGSSSFGQSPFGQSPFCSAGSSGGSPSGSGAEGSGGPSDVGSIAAKVAPALVDTN